MVDAVVNRIEPCVGCSACPAGTATPEAVKAALSATHGLFEESAWTYLNPLLTFSDPPLLRLQLFECWQELLGLSWDENALAVSQALEAQQRFDREMRRLSREILLKLEKEGRIGLVLLGRPYHHDAGINQGIIDAVQKMGFPVLSQSYLPDDEDILDRLFGQEVKAGAIMSPFDISDVWKNSNSANTNQKLWAAKFTARHPNLLPLELSNFKCGHDAFVSQVIEQIFACAGKPCFSFRDLDENKPLASIRLRLETMQFMLDKTRAVPA
jgi:predicted nucleotide-binding protein (sugar kinase/HSP70/actin superfamily)